MTYINIVILVYRGVLWKLLYVCSCFIFILNNVPIKRAPKQTLISAHWLQNKAHLTIVVMAKVSDIE